MLEYAQWGGGRSLKGNFQKVIFGKARNASDAAILGDWRQSDVMAEPSSLEHEPSPAVLVRFARRSEARF